MKKLILSSPFRHSLYLNDDFFYINREIFNNAISELDKQTPNLPISSAWFNQDKPAQNEKYISVKYDSLNLDSKPLLVINFTSQLKQFLPNQPQIELDDNFHLISCYVKIYNNTIGLIDLQLGFENLKQEFKSNPSLLDIQTTKLVQLIEEQLLRAEITDVLKLLQHNIGSSCSKADKKLIYQDHVFAEVLDILKEEHNKVLWTGRLLYAPAQERDEWIEFFEQWALTTVQADGNSAFFRQGNNLVLDDYISQEETIACIDLCQYYYAIFYIANNVVKRVAGGFGNKNNELQTMLNTCQEINLQIKTIEVNQKEALSGLQGKRRKTVQEIFRCWEYDNFLDMVITRNEILQSRIHTLQESERQKFGRVLEFILSLVGLISFADFLLNVTMYTHPEFIPVDGFWGILRSFASVPSEIIMSAVICLVVIFSLIFTLKR